MRAIFIRHGQSTGNAGVLCDDLGAIELTQLGQEQVREVAASWTKAPALLLTSPFKRTRTTAASTIAHLPGESDFVGRDENIHYLQRHPRHGPRILARSQHPQPPSPITKVS